MPRPRERPAAVAAVAPELGRPYSLARLEDRGFSVFAVASPGFWRSRRSVVLGLFANLRQHGVGPAFLVTRQDADCASAATHGIRCVVGQTFGLAEDPYLSMERWSVIEQLLTRRQRVAFVGADVRFIQSAQRLLEASASLDAVFEGRVIPQRGTIGGFTPDLILCNPTAKSAAFVGEVLRGFRAPVSEGLPSGPPFGRENVSLLERHATLLAGPAQQDLLFDTLLNAVYDRPIHMRKIHLARSLLASRELLLRPNKKILRGYWIGPPPGRDGRHGLGRLEMRRVASGVVVTSRRLSFIMSNQRGVLSAERPCERCGWSRADVTAFHCLSKRPECLDVSRCACLQRNSSGRQPRVRLRERG